MWRWSVSYTHLDVYKRQVQTQMQQTEAIQQKVEMVSSVAERINQSMQQTLQVLESAGKDMDVLVSQVDHSVEKGDSVAGQLETLDKYIEEMHSLSLIHIYWKYSRSAL